jgi:hypothetical protein
MVEGVPYAESQDQIYEEHGCTAVVVHGGGCGALRGVLSGGDRQGSEFVQWDEVSAPVSADAGYPGQSSTVNRRFLPPASKDTASWAQGHRI